MVGVSAVGGAEEGLTHQGLGEELVLWSWVA